MVSVLSPFSNTQQYNTQCNFVKFVQKYINSQNCKVSQKLKNNVQILQMPYKKLKHCMKKIYNVSSAVISRINVSCAIRFIYSIKC